MSSHLTEQDTELNEGHKAILADLSEVRTRSQEVYYKIGEFSGSHTHVEQS